MKELVNYFLVSENGTYELTEMQYYYLLQVLYRLKLDYEKKEENYFSRLLISEKEVFVKEISIKLGKGVIVKILNELEKK